MKANGTMGVPKVASIAFETAYVQVSIVVNERPFYEPFCKLRGFLSRYKYFDKVGLFEVRLCVRRNLIS